MMRREKIAVGEYYHIFNRGNNKQVIFNDERDRIRLLCLILYFQSPLSIYNISRKISYFIKHRKFNATDNLQKNLLKGRITELAGFVLMPNHYHLILREIKEGGVSKYLQRIQNSFTKSLNTKYNKSGHLFQGVFQRVRIKNNEQLLHLSAYIHRNPRELKGWTNKEHQFPWSSYQDYIGINRWGNFLKHQIITRQFSNAEEYKKFVETSGAKLLNKEHFLG